MTEEPKPEFPQQPSTHNGNTVGYTVEARCAFHEPRSIAGVLLGKEWKRLTFEKAPAPFGVPIAPPWHNAIFGMLSLYEYSAAQALRWWFHANADASMEGICLETRIVAHSVKYSMSSTAISEHALIGGEDRTSVVPDWNTPKQPKAA